MGYERNNRRYGGTSDERGRDYRDTGADRGRSYGAYDNRTGSRGERYGRPDDDRNDRDDQDRGFFERAGDEVRSWFGDDEAERRRRQDDRDGEREWRYGDGGRFSSRGGGYQGGGFPGGGSGRADFGGGRSTGDYGAGRGAGATGNWGLGAGNDRNEWGRDPGYHSWRDRQLQQFDTDYDEYRREHQSKFDQEFHGWRQNRQSQRDQLGKVQEHQEVVGSDGQHIGTVDHVRGDRIKLTKQDQDAGGHHHSIPSSWIVSVDDRVTISKTADQAKAAWRDEEREQGGLFGGRDDDRGARDRSRTTTGSAY